MKRFAVTVTQDRGGEFSPVTYTAEFCGMKAAIDAYCIACRAAFLEPGPRTRLGCWTRQALPGSRMSYANNLRTITVTFSRTL